MAFHFDDAQGTENPARGLFKSGVKFSYMKADERRPITFRLLPAFPEHDGELTQEDRASAYVPAVTMVGGRPSVADWAYPLIVSRSFLKGSFPVVSRTTVCEYNDDGTPVAQEDPLTQLHAYIRANDAEWGYIAHDIGEWGSKSREVAKLPFCRKEYVMNVLTFDDEKPGVKLAVVSSGMAMADLASTRSGREGLALQQNTMELTQEQVDADPSCIFLYGDITDPNSAPVLKYFRGLSDDGGKKVYKIQVAMEVDPNTGRQRVQRVGLDYDMMSQRVDLAHPETYVNIPTVEEQLQQIVNALCGRNKNGVHEYDLLHAALPDYASMIPSAPPAPGAQAHVQGWAPAQEQPRPQPQPQPQPNPQAQPRFSPKAQLKPAQEGGQEQAKSRPGFVPSPQPITPPTRPARQPKQGGVEGIPGEAKFDKSAWEQMAKGQAQGQSTDWVSQYTKDTAEAEELNDSGKQGWTPPF